MNVFGCILESPCPSVCLYIHVSVWEQNNSFCQSTGKGINTLPNNQILNMTKLKAFSDDKLNVDKKTQCLS